MPDTTPPEEVISNKHSERWKWWIGVIVVPVIIVPLVTWGITNWPQSDSSDAETAGTPIASDDATSPTGSSTAAAAPTTPDETTFDETTPDEGAVSTDIGADEAADDHSPEPSVQYLNTLEGDRGMFLNEEYGGYEVDDILYPHSVRIPVDADGESQHAISYDIDGEWDILKVWVGLDDESEEDNELYFQVYIDDQPIEPGVTRSLWEEAEKIEIPVAGAHRIKLTVTWISGGKANDGDVTYAVWGDAQLNR